MGALPKVESMSSEITVNDQSSRVVFVSSSINQPRHQKRIEALAEQFDVFVIYNARRLYYKNAEAFDYPKEKRLFLGIIENSKHYLRVPLFLKMIRTLKARPEKTAYCTSVEGVAAALIAKKNVIHELGDMHQFGLLKGFYIALDFVLTRKVAAMFITSPWFISEYYQRYFPKQKHKFNLLENRMAASMQPVIEEYRHNLEFGVPQGRRVKLGLIGSLRYPRMLQAIRELVEARDDLELHIHGDDGGTRIFDGMEKCTNHGVYKNPQELSAIYSNIDITLILYDDQDRNVRWALPNKLYESLAFLRPILCSVNCCLADVVVPNNYGVASELENLSSSVDRLLKDYNNYQQRFLALEPKTYLNDDVFRQSVHKICQSDLVQGSLAG